MSFEQTCRSPLPRPPPCRGSGYPGIGLVLCLLLLVAASLTSPTASADADADERVRIAGVVYLGDLPTVIADHENLFRSHGVDATVAFNPSGRENLGRLRAGEVDFALMALTPLVLDRLADPSPGGLDDPVILASLVHSTRLNHVVVRTDRGIETPADLQGRRVGLRKGTNAEFVWWLFARFHGLDPDAVELVDTPVSRLPTALRTGAVDVGVIWEPWFSRLQAETGNTLRSFPGSNIYTAQWVLATNRETARDRPARCRAMLAAYRDAIALIEREPERAIRTYARRADVSEEILRRSWEAQDFELNLEWSIVATLQQQLDWALRTGRQPVAPPVEVLSLIDSGPLRSLDSNRVGIPRMRRDGESGQ